MVGTGKMRLDAASPDAALSIESEEAEMSQRTDEALEAVESLGRGDTAPLPVDPPGFSRRAFIRRTAVTGVAASTVGTVLAACGSGGSSTSAASGSGSAAVFGSHPSYKFVFVNHVTTNPFFVPTQYG